jgi:hypothetical protein
MDDHDKLERIEFKSAAFGNSLYENKGSGSFELMMQESEALNFDPESHSIKLKFTDIEQYKSYLGDHEIQIILSDSDRLSSDYTLMIKLEE